MSQREAILEPTHEIPVELVEKRLDDTSRRAQMDSPRFGQVFSEHMLTMRWTKDGGWQDGAIVPFAPITLSPAASVLHYGQSVFEGFKAYRWQDGSIRLFRPLANLRRMCRSAERLAMPPLPVEPLLEAVDQLIELERDWVPDKPEHSLYVRPIMFATQSGLGVKPSDSYQLLVILSPVGSYFASGVKPVTVWLAQDYIRAAPGGTGTAKFAGNYAASLIGQARALERGCDQVVWLDAVERRYVEEMGGMNICFAMKGSSGKLALVTPTLETGTLLPGITRDSLLTLAKEKGFDAVERRVSIDEWESSVADGTMTEAFACGTAAVITPIGTVKSKRGTWIINDNQMGPMAAQLRNELLDIQYGRKPDRHGWMHRSV